MWWQGRLRAVAFAAVAAVSVSGTALGYWKTVGSGSGSSTTASTTQALVLSAGSPASRLHPGGSAGVAVTITNANPYSVRVAALTLDSSQGTGGFAVDAGHSGCSVSALSYATQNAGWTVPAKVGGTDGTLALDLANAVTMSSAAANACQGATFSVYLAAS